MKRWKKIPGYSRYEASITGNIRHRKYKKILKVTYPKNGYGQVNVRNDLTGKGTSTCVHILMAATYISKRPKGMWIGFRNNDKTDCHYKNIYYRKP